MKTEVDHVGDDVEREAREFRAEGRRESPPVSLFVLLPANCVNFPEVWNTEGIGRKLVEQVQVQPRAGSK